MSATRSMAVAATVVALCPLGGCDREEDPAPSEPSSKAAGSSAASSAPPSPSSSRVSALRAIEHRRSSKDVTEEDVTSRNVETRRAAARALARIVDARAVELLGKTLADEDPEVVVWSAYGLGYGCEGHAPQVVPALVSRAASLAGKEGTAPRSSPTSAMDAIAQGLARCATRDAERTLRAWLQSRGPHADAAALALGRIASSKKRLDDASLVALLDAAGDDPPLETALFAFTRLSAVSPNVRTRLLDVATEALAGEGPRRAFAVRALALAGDEAVEPLGRLLVNRAMPASLRADAAHGLARLGDAGAEALGAALADLIPDDPNELLSATWAPLIATVDALKPPARAGKDTLSVLATMAIPEAGSSGLRRRIVRLRCKSAGILAGTASLAKRLVECDPEQNGREGELATLAVLDRGPLTRGRYRRWKQLASSKDPIVRERALSLMPSHPEIVAPHAVLAEALAHEQDGIVATAAAVLSAYPDRASADHDPGDRRAAGEPAEDPSSTALDPDDALVEALTRAFEAERAPDAIEVRAELMGAAAALQILSLKPKIEPFCKSSNPTLRSRAEHALRVLGDKLAACNDFTPPKVPPEELTRLVTSRVRIALRTDVGELGLELDPTLAPVAVTRLADLSKSGFYDGTVVHRVVPGFVVQLGDPNGDGYGGAGRAPLRCETSPVTFDALSVGIALGGRDTGSSQLFVTLGPFPHLTGDYPLVGRATGPWAAVAEGDVIQEVRVVE